MKLLNWSALKNPVGLQRKLEVLSDGWSDSGHLAYGSNLSLGQDSACVEALWILTDPPEHHWIKMKSDSNQAEVKAFLSFS